MLNKKNRLKKYSAFIATYKVNDTVSDANICIYFGREKTNPQQDTKFAFVVSKKIHKRAVVRNRIKRLMRESVRLMIKNGEINHIYKYMSVICVAKPASVGNDFPSVNASLSTLISKKSN